MTGSMDIRGVSVLFTLFQSAAAKSLQWVAISFSNA